MAGDAVTDESPVAVHTLANGVRVAIEPLSHLHSTSIGIWIGAGSALEKAAEAGISHFLEHLFFKGTEKRNVRELMDAIESKGGHMNAYTTREYTCLYVRTLEEHLPLAIEILGDILKHSIFADFEKERNVILEEIATSQDVPEDYTHDLLTQKVWPQHALGRPIAGSIESVSGIELDAVHHYKDRWYYGSNMVISVVGGCDEAATLQQVRDEFGSLPPGPPHDKDGAAQFQNGIQIVERDIAQNHVAFAFPGPSIVDERRYAYDMLCNVLGGGSTSRLFDRIREREGLTYSIYAFNSGYTKTGMLGVYAAIAPENVARTLSLASEEIRRLKDEPIPAVELSSNAEQLKGGLLLGLEGTFNRMARYARSLMCYDRIQPLAEIVDSIDAVTAKDLQSLAQETFTNELCAMSVLGPEIDDVIALEL